MCDLLCRCCVEIVLVDCIFGIVSICDSSGFGVCVGFGVFFDGGVCCIGCGLMMMQQSGDCVLFDEEYFQYDCCYDDEWYFGGVFVEDVDQYVFGDCYDLDYGVLQY